MASHAPDPAEGSGARRRLPPASGTDRASRLVGCTIASCGLHPDKDVLSLLFPGFALMQRAPRIGDCLDSAHCSGSVHRQSLPPQRAGRLGDGRRRRLLPNVVPCSEHTSPFVPECRLPAAPFRHVCSNGRHSGTFFSVLSEAGCHEWGEWKFMLAQGKPRVLSARSTG